MYNSFIGVSKEIEKIRNLINHVADTGLNVIITGETGVGKEVIARLLHNKSPRKAKPFVKINCAALPEGLLESELFGYEQGAFTGATKKKLGKFEIANGGVLFLDEIGDMPGQLQAKLLHVLQNGEYTPLGSEREYWSDSWVIAATNHDLIKKINSKQFRADLYYRLNIIKIEIPPLRERPEDILQLIHYYTKLFSIQFKHKNFSLPDEKTISALMAYHWPGNVRQLQNVLKRVLILGNRNEIIDEVIKESEGGNKREKSTCLLFSGMGSAPSINLESEFADNAEAFSLKRIRKKAIDRIEHQIISFALEKTGWNRSRAAKMLKISYKTLLYKIHDLNIARPSSKQ